MRHLSISYDPDLELDAYTNLLIISNSQLISLKVEYTEVTTTKHLLLIRNSLPNLRGLTLAVNKMHVDKEPFKPLLFENLQFLCISCSGTISLNSIVITTTLEIERLKLSIEGNIDQSCITFLKRHQSKGNFRMSAFHLFEK